MIPIEQQIDECVERVLGYRRRVYARRVAEKKMTQALADRELERMAAVLYILPAVLELLQDVKLKSDGPIDTEEEQQRLL